jgi:hypothetical protein
MKFKFKYITILVTLASFASIIYGFTLVEETPSLGHKYIGGGTIGLFLLAMPLFLIRESRGKSFKNYMLNKENIEKMQEYQQKKPKKR